MTDLDLDAIEARANAASGGRLDWKRIDALRSLVETDVPALVAALREAREAQAFDASIVEANEALGEALREARAESQRATSWHVEALDDLATCVAERDDWRRRYEALRADYNHLNERLDFAVETGSKMIKRFEALRDGVWWDRW